MQRAHWPQVGSDLRQALESSPFLRRAFYAAIAFSLFAYSLYYVSGRAQKIFSDRAWPASAQKIDFGDGQVYLDCRGSGEPTVLFDAPIGAGADYWRQQQEIISKYSRACVFDRFGYGLSSPLAREANADQQAVDIDRLWRLSRMTRPFVYVSSGSGIYTAQSLAKNFPDSLAGIVISDPSGNSADDPSWPPDGGERESIARARWFGRLARFNLLHLSSASFLSRFSAFIRPLAGPGYGQEVLLPRFWQSVASELAALPESRRRVRDELIGFMPFSVLWSSPEGDCAALESEDDRSARRLRAESLASLSSGGLALAVPGVCRDLAIEKPESLVPEILRAVEKHRDFLINGR
jgi:pimeloyl-ACP methyl ester carboxylesterase